MMQDKSERRYTAAMMKEFDKLSMMACDLNQVRRIEGRMALQKYIEMHGKDVCEEMFRVLQEKDKAKRKRHGR
jgi:hypothetical protein